MHSNPRVDDESESTDSVARHRSPWRSHVTAGGALRNELGTATGLKVLVYVQLRPDHGQEIYAKIVRYRLAYLTGVLDEWSEHDRVHLSALVNRLATDLAAEPLPR